MNSRPVTGGACCCKSDSRVTQLFIAGDTVGIINLNAALEQLWALGRKPNEATDQELLGMVRAQKNYIPFREDIEATYAKALRREYAAFYERRNR